ncbi:MAG: MFS transporter [Acidobacteria bacterium]|nr:MFS transporter [Acidobacteriota bacterium]
MFRLWVPTVTMLLVSLISYIDRTTLAILAPTVLKETGLTVEDYGWIISTFSTAYMIGNPVWGKLLDRIGLPRGMTMSVAFWTLASTAHAFAQGFWTFAIARAALGFGEGATFPAGLRAAVQSLPPHLCSRGIAISYSGGSLGAVVTPLIVGPVAAAWGWRGAFWFTGAVGAAWLILWYFVSQRADMQSTASRATEDAAIAWGDRRVWAFMAAYALGAFPLAFVLYQSSLFLNRAMKLSQSEVAALLWIPPLGWEAGYFVWGWLTDTSLRRSARPLAVYRGLMGAATLLSLPLAAVPSIGQPGASAAVVMFCLFFAMFVAAGFVIAPISYATRAFSRRNASLIAGLGAGSWGAFVALLMPRIGRLLDRQDYGTAFWVSASCPVLGYALWFVLSRGTGFDEEPGAAARP